MTTENKQEEKKEELLFCSKQKLQDIIKQLNESKLFESNDNNALMDELMILFWKQNPQHFEEIFIDYSKYILDKQTIIDNMSNNILFANEGIKYIDNVFFCKQINK